MAENENKELSEELVPEEAENDTVANAEEEVEAVEENNTETALVPAEENKPAKKKSKEEKKPGIFVRIGRSLKKFWKSMKSELKRVTWISRKQTFTSTLLVLVCMAISMVVIGLLDVGLSVGLEAIANLF